VFIRTIAAGMQPPISIGIAIYKVRTTVRAFVPPKGCLVPNSVWVRA